MFSCPYIDSDIANSVTHKCNLHTFDLIIPRTAWFNSCLELEKEGENVAFQVGMNFMPWQFCRDFAGKKQRHHSEGPV